jgi:hypothetical protein
MGAGLATVPPYEDFITNDSYIQGTADNLSAYDLYPKLNAFHLGTATTDFLQKNHQDMPPDRTYNLPPGTTSVQIPRELTRVVTIRACSSITAKYKKDCNGKLTKNGAVYSWGPILVNTDGQPSPWRVFSGAGYTTL